MAITTITTATKLNQQTALILAYYGYDRSNTPTNDLKATLGSDWKPIDQTDKPLSINLGANYNIQTKVGDATIIENSFNIYVNESTGLIAISFKGSDVASNFVSDLGNNGGSEYLKIATQAQAALDLIRTEYPEYQIFATGHSLGGGMAQTFALKNGLDVQVVNSLPIARSIIDSGYFDSIGGYSNGVAGWRAAGHVIDDIRTPNDIATFNYNDINKGTYLSKETDLSITILPGAQMPDFMKGILVATIFSPLAPVGLIALGSMGADHPMDAALGAAAGLPTDLITGKFIIPENHQGFVNIPSSLREQLSQFSNRPITAVTLDNYGKYTITRQDGAIQSLEFNAVTGDASINQNDAIGNGYTLLNFNTKNQNSPITLKKYNVMGDVTDSIASSGDKNIIKQIFDDGSSITSTSEISGTLTTVTTNDDGSLYKTEVTSLTPFGNETKVTDGTGTLVQAITRQGDDNGNTLVITTNADGSGTAQTFDDTGAEIASASFNKTGGINGTTGTLTEDVNGRTVVLDVNFNDGGGDADGDGVMDRNEAGYDLHSSIDLTGINSIGGQPVVNDSSLDAALNAANLDLADLWAGVSGGGVGSGTFNQLINAGDASNPDGYTRYTPPAGVAWYQTPEAQQFGNTLTDIQSLLSALKSGQPLPIATSLFNLAAHLSNFSEGGGDPTLAGAASGLNLITSVLSFRNALNRGDALGSLVAAGSLTSNALPNKRFKSCKRSNLSGKYGCSRRVNYKICY